jgi:hypothetical protein
MGPAWRLRIPAKSRSLPWGPNQETDMKLFATTLAAAALFGGTPLALAASDVGGSYQVNGTNFDGSKYKGTAKITITSKTTCNIEWKTGGGSSSVGICMRNDDSFSAAYKMKDGAVGLIIYKMLDDGTMEGVWTLSGMDGAGTEVLTPAH